MIEGSYDYHHYMQVNKCFLAISLLYSLVYTYGSVTIVHTKNLLLHVF